MTEKKISIITYPTGGPFVWAKNLAAELKKRGFAVRFYAGRKDYLKALTVRHEIVHTCVPLPLLQCKKYILTIHGNYQKEKHLARFFFPWITSRAAYLTTPSDFLKQELNITKAKVIPNGINLPQTYKNSFAFIGECLAFGILTNFNFRKKAEGVLSLAKVSAKISPQSKLLIAGNGTFADEYKKRIIQFHPNIEFLGHCKKETLFNKIDVFAYFSYLDNLPLALLEAMAAGLPIVAFATGAIPEIFTGKLQKYLAKSEADFFKILKNLAESEEERRFCSQIMLNRAKDYSWEKIISQFIELYEEN